MTTDTPRLVASCQLIDVNEDIYRERKRAEKAEAESESRRVALVAMIKANNKLEAEVERLKAKLYRAIEIADEFWNNQKQAVLIHHQELADELERIKAALNKTK